MNINLSGNQTGSDVAIVRPFMGEEVHAQCICGTWWLSLKDVARVLRMSAIESAVDRLVRPDNLGDIVVRRPGFDRLLRVPAIDLAGLIALSAEAPDPNAAGQLLRWVNGGLVEGGVARVIEARVVSDVVPMAGSGTLLVAPEAAPAAPAVRSVASKLLEVFSYAFDGHPVRVVRDDAGEPWFVATDVADVLGYAEAKDLTRNLDDDEKGRQIVPTPGGAQEMAIINESGLYSAILKSRKPEAKSFRRWVTSAVLPSIRKTGGYGTQTAVSSLLSDLPTLQRLLATVTDRTIKAEAELAKAAPMAAALERFAKHSDGSLCVRDAATHLGVRETDLSAYMLAHRWAYRRGTNRRLYPTAEAIQRGRLEVKVAIDAQNVERGSNLRVTRKGLAALSMLVERGLIPLAASRGTRARKAVQA